MLQMTKMFRIRIKNSIILIFNTSNFSMLVFATITLLSFSINAVEKNKSSEISKIFIYQSRLPNSLIRKKKNLRSHVIDVLLSTQKYEVVFSKIPEFIARGDIPQVILKYKIRTGQSLKSLFDLEFTLIDADAVKIKKTIRYVDIPKSKLLYQFRLHLYEFILGKKLTNQEEKKFAIKSKIKIAKLDKALASEPPSAEGQPSIGDIKKNNKKIKNNINKLEIIDPPVNKPKVSQNKNEVINKKSLSLWDLLKDNDEDSSWAVLIIEKNQSRSEEENKSNENNKDQNDKITGPANPFLKTKIFLKEEDQEDIRIDMFHIAWRIVDREQEVTDLVALTNSFFSILGLTFEWVIHNPFNIENLFFRTGFEVDKSLKTTPIKLSDHSLFRLGFGLKLPLNILPSIYLETNSLVFANLNTAGEGFQDNIISIYWTTLELAYLTEKFYLGLQYSQSLDTSTLLEGINFTNLKGNRIGANVRYFSDYKIFSLDLWADLEYRVEKFDAKNLDFSSRKLNVIKNELAVKFGVYF